MALNYFPSKQLSVTNHTSKQDQLTQMVKLIKQKKKKKKS